MEEDLQSFITQDLINQTNQTLKIQQLLSEKIVGLNEINFLDWQIYGTREAHNEFTTKYYLILNNFTNPFYPRVYSVQFYDFRGMEIDEDCNHKINGFYVRADKNPRFLNNNGDKQFKWWDNFNEANPQDWVVMDNKDLITQKIIGITLLSTTRCIISSSGEYSNSTIELDIDSEDISLQFNYPAK